MTEEPDGLIDALARTAFTVTAVLQRVGALHDLSLTQMRVLGVLRDRRLRMAVLAEHLGLDRSSLTGLVDRAERRGLCTRVRSETDGRSVDVVLTADGLDLAARMQAQVADALAPLLDAYAPAERRRLQALLERMLAEPGTRGVSSVPVP